MIDHISLSHPLQSRQTGHIMTALSTGTAAQPPPPGILDALTERGLVAQITHRQDLADHLAEGARSCYLGIDPTATSLHVGHLMSLTTARKLQQAGHRIIVVLGSATALIGDPSGKSSARRMLTPAEITHNTTALRKQLSHFLNLTNPEQGLILHNADWLHQLTYLEFIQSIGRHVSVNRMLASECYKSRLGTSLSFLEFNYMLLQSYDFYHLHKHHNVTVQIGGNDQWSHMLAGIDLIRRLSAQAAFAFTTPLLLSSQGEKMGKTLTGALWLDPQRCSPLDFFQYWRNINDQDLASCLQWLTHIPVATLAPLQRLSELDAATINDFKIQLASNLTTTVHGATAAHKAAQATQQLHRTDAGAQAGSALAELVDPAVLPTHYFNHAPELSIQDILVAYAVVKSKKEARRLIDQGGLEVDGAPCADPFMMIPARNLLHQGLVIKKGKKSHYLLKLTDHKPDPITSHH